MTDSHFADEPGDTSPVADPLFREVPHAVDDDEIAEIIAGYVKVAEHCKAGGFDGVELQCSHSSIVRALRSAGTASITARTSKARVSRESPARMAMASPKTLWQVSLPRR